jgi:spermidine synthase
MPETTPADADGRPMNRAPLFLLYLNVLIIATCGLIYELLAGTLASYVLGDSVTQFSLVIGVYLSALGVGAWLSRFVTKQLAWTFLEVELGVALIGGLSAPVLFFTFAATSAFALMLYGVVFAIGTLVGLELPLLMRILKERLDFSDLISRVLAFDYIGALAASVLFPILFVPRLGLVRTSLVFGMLNALVALWGTWLLAPLLPRRLLGLRVRAIGVLALLATGVVFADRLTTLAEEQVFSNPVVYAKSTPYQRIVVTRGTESFQLFLNGNLQFNSIDEYRYHEALVHPALTLAGGAKNVLVLGGGDGLAVREVLKHPSVEQVTLVDIDPAMTALGKEVSLLAKLSGNALEDPRVRLVHEDAMIWLEEREGPPFDAVIIDFPDPNTLSLGKLYTTRFYRLLRPHVAEGGAIGIQCTSPLVARRSFWCILRTMEAAGFSVVPYHATVPSFGVWGYGLASTRPFDAPTALPAHLGGKLKYLDDGVLHGLFQMPADIGPLDVEINRLDNQMLVRYYESESKRWN